MSLEEYHRLPFSLVWKQEYINGDLVESPRGVDVHATVPIAPRRSVSPAQLRAARLSDERALLPCFRAAFAEAFEFCDYTKARFRQAARESLHHFFRGPFHCPLLPASQVALAPAGARNAGKPIGAALLLAQDEGWALLYMIFVSPAWQRRGLATALAAATVTALHELGGYRTLVSRYHLGNEASRAWHHDFGFVDEPDLFLARLHFCAAQQELRRQRELGTLTAPLKHRLTRERDQWQREVDRLDAAIKEGREAEACPWHKWRSSRTNNDTILIRNPYADIGKSSK